MTRYWLLAFAAGLGSAVVFTGINGVSPVGMLVAYLAPAPLFLCGLVLGIPATVVAGGVGAVVSLLALGPLAAIVYLLADAVPVAILTRQALLSRPAEDGSVEWYPPGLLTAWLTGLGMAGLMTLGTALMREDAGLEGSVRGLTGQAATLLAVPDPQFFVELTTPLFPAMAVVACLVMLTVSAALAQAGAVAMKRNLRPTPDFAGIRLPTWPLAVGAVAVAGGLMLGGDTGYLLRNVAVVAAIPFLFQGLAVLHLLNRRTGGGMGMLAVFYTLLMALSWVALPIILLGLVEQFVGIRARLLRGAPPELSE